VIESTSFIGGRFVKEFERDFAEFTTAKHIIGVGNGTDALIIALKSLDLPPKSEIIVPANSFIATSEAVTQAGHTLIFCDIDPNTYLIDLEKASELLTPKTKGIIPVHLYGQMVHMELVKKLADTHGLVIIEDAAQAHGVKYNGVNVGELSDCACYSFYPGKNLGAYGDGGAITTNNNSLVEKIRKFANHGRSEKYNHEFEGLNSRLDGLQAAILTVKLKYLDKWNDYRKNAAKYYCELLNDLDIPLPLTNEESRHVYHLFVTQIDNRDYVLKKLRSEGIGAGIHYPIALPFLKAYKYLKHNPKDFPVAYRQMSCLISLPIFPEITQEQIEYTVDCFKASL
jgi:dTDP-4-amino-4,6-dideoxygalactose transaminase